MGSNGQQIAVVLPKGAKGSVHVRGKNQFDNMADWHGDVTNWAVSGSDTWFGVFTDNWWFKGDVEISYTDSAGKPQSWVCPSVPGTQDSDAWTTTSDDHKGHTGFPSKP